MLELQRAAGNAAVSWLVTEYHGNGITPQISLHGTTTPFFDGGVGTVLNPRTARARGCDCPEGEPCMEATATLQVTYKVEVTIEMPEVPGGLTPCQERRVRTWLRRVLAPHEEDHARRLRTYDGTTRRRLSVKACGRDAVKAAAEAKAQEMHTREAELRAKKADDLSLAIDPFEREIDPDCGRG